MNSPKAPNIDSVLWVTVNEKSIRKLTEGNWPNWSRRCRAALKYNGLWNLIEGWHAESPTDKSEREEWLDKNEQIIGTLCELVDTSLIDSVESQKQQKQPGIFWRRKHTKVELRPNLVPFKWSYPPDSQNLRPSVNHHRHQRQHCHNLWWYCTNLRRMDNHLSVTSIGWRTWVHQRKPHKFLNHIRNITHIQWYNRMYRDEGARFPCTRDPTKRWSCLCCMTEHNQRKISQNKMLKLFKRRAQHRKMLGKRGRIWRECYRVVQEPEGKETREGKGSCCNYRWLPIKRIGILCISQWPFWSRDEWE